MKHIFHIAVFGLGSVILATSGLAQLNRKMPPITLKRTIEKTAAVQRQQLKIDESLWPILEQVPDSAQTINLRELIKTNSLVKEGYENYLPAYRLYQDYREGRISREHAERGMLAPLERSRLLFENALKADPLIPEIRKRLYYVYLRLEPLYRSGQNRIQYLQLGENLVRLRQDQKEYYGPRSRPLFLNRLGDAYKELNLWHNAYLNYHKAVEALFEAYGDEVNPTTLRIYLYNRGLAEIELGQDELALISFQRALKALELEKEEILAKVIKEKKVSETSEEEGAAEEETVREEAPETRDQSSVTSEEEKKLKYLQGRERDIRRKMDWITWDDGNLLASKKFDQAKELFFKENKYEQAKQAFLELLDQVQTEKAADEVNYWIARLDFYYLDNKEEGISRLWEVIKKTPIDSATGAPVDSTYQTYFDYYGRMCYKLGDEKRSDFQREAFIYFSKAASIDNPNRAMSLYRLALLSNIDAETAMDYASQAWALKEELSQLYQRYVARILYQSYQKKGEFDEAVRWYRRYIELK